MLHQYYTSYTIQDFICDPGLQKVMEELKAYYQDFNTDRCAVLLRKVVSAAMAGDKSDRDSPYATEGLATETIPLTLLAVSMVRFTYHIYINRLYQPVFIGYNLTGALCDNSDFEQWRNFTEDYLTALQGKNIRVVMRSCWQAAIQARQPVSNQDNAAIWRRLTRITALLTKYLVLGIHLDDM